MYKKILIVLLVSIIYLIALSVYQQKKFSDGKLRVVFCDVGQGDGIYIRTPKGSDIIIDGGPDNSILLCLSNNMPFWDRKIDLLVLTHPHADHYAGLLTIAKRYKINSFATTKTSDQNPGYKELERILNEKGTSKRFICKGDRFKMDAVSLKIFWPESCLINQDLAKPDPNDDSIAGLLSYRNFQVLLTGDAGEEVAEKIDDEIGDIDILKVPHHGSRTGFDTDFLKKVTPETAIISVGAKNKYGHPSRNIVDMLNSSKIKTFRTDKNGGVMIVSDGKIYRISSERGQ